MDKRYQVFVSSTYADLKEERSKVIQTLLELDCIPTGMELFPAADEEQWEFIKRVIFDCDYYLLIIGGRYGSITTEGISYTEKEYDYAVQQGIKVVALIHANPLELPASKFEIDENLRQRLDLFREKVKTNRLVKFWNNTEELPGLVALSISKTIKMYPAIGWIRGDKVSSENLLNEINEIRKENEKLKREISHLAAQANMEIEDIATLEDSLQVFGKYKPDGFSKRNWSVTTSWGEIFSIISPYLLKFPNDGYVKIILEQDLFEKYSHSFSNIVSYNLDDQLFQTIKIQLMAMNLVKIDWSATTKGGYDLFWSLTSLGSAIMMKLRTVRRNQS
jgi:hypothetical protein